MHTTRFNILLFMGAFLCALFFLTPARAGNEKRFTLVIDAGHGGHDPGAIGRNVKEKNINLKVALKLGKLIEQNMPDVRVVYTRNRDVFIPLHRRAEIANNAKADLFVSIHTNSVASRNSRVSGAETYTLGLHRTQENLEVAQKENSVILIEDDYKQQYAGFNPNSAESYIIFEFLQDKYMAQSVNLARQVQRQFRSNGRQDKGVHQAGFLVLRETSMPSILIELGYITNPTEAAYLISENGSATMARSIYTAIANYKNQQRATRKGEAVAGIPENNGRPADGQEFRTAEGNTQANPLAEDTSVAQADTEEVATRNPSAGSTPDQASEVRPARHPSKGEASRPVFKIQITTSSRVLPKGSRLLKGLTPVSYYKENGLVKYTYGEDTDYNRILRLKRNKVDAKFKDAFIIAFKDGKKMNINEAIREFKRNRRK